MRTWDGKTVDYDSLTEADFQTGHVYNSCECPCGCQREARFFPGGMSVRPNLCRICTPPDDEHEREMTEADRAILARP